MKICVYGLWHLGSVIASGLASVGHEVVGLDEDQATVNGLKDGKAPIFEPGLDSLIRQEVDMGRLHFSTQISDAVSNIDILWVAFDTPVDKDDRADVNYVVGQIESVMPSLPHGVTIVVSSQMPIGSIMRLEGIAAGLCPELELSFACSPENLRLGKALEVFLNPDRIVVGVRTERDRIRLKALISPLTDRIEWMSIESAEMTKHAINAFLATSVTFANELATVCEKVGADAKQVERGLKTDSRIGARAYLSPGRAFAGGTLARDVEYLTQTSGKNSLNTPLLASIRPSNEEHKNWARNKLKEKFPSLLGIKVALWGLTYKLGTDTLRRSSAVALCDWLIGQGAEVAVYDPVVKNIPKHWQGCVNACNEALDAVAGADVLIVGTDWPEFRDKTKEILNCTGPQLIVIDESRHLQDLAEELHSNYISVGSPTIMRGK